MILRSFSKVNLSLNINKKLKHELHDIQSYFCLIDLSDQLKIKIINGKKDIVNFKGKFAKDINKKKNSILTTLKLLREKKQISNFYSVSVKKDIPVFAGLGGGTGNSACLIDYFVKRKKVNKLLKFFDNEVGSDLKLFFYNQGFLNNINSIKNFKKTYSIHFLLVQPNIKNSTKVIYSKVTKYSKKFRYSFDEINSKERFIKHLTNKTNDLQLIVEKKYPFIKKLLLEIAKNKGCYFSRMTGSGSVCYGVFKSKKTAKVALNKIKKKYPKFWSSVAKTI